MTKYFPKSPRSYGESISVSVDLSNYAKKKLILKILLILTLQDLH